MKFRNCKLEIRNLLLIILLFFTLYLIPTKIFAATPAETTTTSAVTTTTTTTPQQNENLWTKIVNFFLSRFVKDYVISTENRPDQAQRFTDYGTVDDLNNNSIDNRSTDFNQQLLLKGEYIKDAINGKVSDKYIAKICKVNNKQIFSAQNTNGDCSDFTINSLALYFVTDNQSFLYDKNGNSIPIPDDLKTKILTNTTPILSDSIEFAKYKTIYNDFYRVPPQKEDVINNKNASKVLRNPIPANSQTSDIPDDKEGISRDIENSNSVLNNNFSPDGTSTGLKGLRSESDI